MPPECTHPSEALGRWSGSSEGVSENDLIREMAPMEVSNDAQKETNDFREVPRVICVWLAMKFEVRH
jgi:hypothetical protein